MRCALGIDTSCYTTSVALAGEGGVIASRRRLLDVAQGARGLRQSEALFQHVQRLPALLEDMLREAADARIACVCASARPRDAEGSYMPVFTAGTAFARSIGAALRVPVRETSHQQGHVRAAMEGAGALPGEFIALHLSGGTTEALRVREGLKIERLGGSSDLHAGQLVDRVGVRMGLSFPAGPALEAMARRGTAPGAAPEDVAAEVYSYLARAVAYLISDAYGRTRLSAALISGGVASSALLRELLPARLAKLSCPVQAHWGKPEMSGDNACGVALIGWEEQNNGKNS